MIQWTVSLLVGLVGAFVLAALGTPVWLTVIVLGIFFAIELTDNG